MNTEKANTIKQAYSFPSASAHSTMSHRFSFIFRSCESSVLCVRCSRASFVFRVAYSRTLVCMSKTYGHTIVAAAEMRLISFFIWNEITLSHFSRSPMTDQYSTFISQLDLQTTPSPRVFTIKKYFN